MAIPFTCIGCNLERMALDSQAGECVKCRSCGMMNLVPELPPEPVETAPASTTCSISCPHCQATLSFAPQYATRNVPCSKCGNPVREQPSPIEQDIFRDGSVGITTSHFQNGGVTYRLAEITNVQVINNGVDVAWPLSLVLAGCLFAVLSTIDDSPKVTLIMLTGIALAASVVLPLCLKESFSLLLVYDKASVEALNTTRKTLAYEVGRAVATALHRDISAKRSHALFGQRISRVNMLALLAVASFAAILSLVLVATR